MNIDKFKHQHVAILRDIATLRQLVHGGIDANAEQIAARLIGMSGNIKLHLAVEDRVLYPVLRTSADAALARMSLLYQGEMADIVAAYLDFAATWQSAAQVRANAEQFRADANNVLRTLHQRMQKEDHEFYPAIEMIEGERRAA